MAHPSFFPVWHLAFSGTMERKRNILDAIAIGMIWLIALALVYLVIAKYLATK